MNIKLYLLLYEDRYVDDGKVHDPFKGGRGLFFILLNESEVKI